ncbi:MAG: rhomboid family intramembrane serine protease [Microcoleaceae cyanobacterium]
MSRNTTTGREAQGLLQEVKSQVLILGGLVALMWATEIIDFFLGGALNRFGIIPRTVVGLRGILFAPFLHGNFAHLIANTVPFVTLGWLVMLRRTSDFLWVSAISMVVGGLGTWLFAPRFSVHIGASGVIFGYLGYLLARGYFERKLGSMLFSIVVAILYGGLLWGILPLQYGVSWQGHLFGLIGGIVAAKFLTAEKSSTQRNL